MSNASGKISGLGRSPGTEYLGVCSSNERFDVFRSPRGQNQWQPIQPRAATSFYLDRMPIAYSPDGTWFAQAIWQWPYVALYKKVSGTWVYQPTSVFSALPTAECSAVAFNPASSTLIVCQQTSPYINIYTHSSGVWTRASNPTSLPTSAARSAAFNRAGTSLAIASESSPFVHIYNISGTTYTKLSNPASLPASGPGTSVDWNADGTHLALSTFASPFIHVWTRSGDTFTKLSNPASLPGGNSYHLKYNQAGTSIAMGHSTSPYISIYNISGTTYTKLSNPASLPTGTGYAVDWNSDGTSLVHMGGLGTASRWLTIYNRSGDTFTKLSDPSVQPNGQAAGAAWSTSTGNLLVAFCTSPGLIEYSRSADTFTDQNIFGRTTATNILLAPDKGNNQYNCCAISPDGVIYANATQNNNPNWAIARRNSDTSFSSFTLTAGVATSGGVSTLAFNTSSDYVSIATEVTPYFNVYKLDRSALTMSALTLPASLATAGQGTCWTTIGGTDRVYVTITGAPYIISYTRSTTALTNENLTIGTNPTGAPNGIASTSDGAVVAVAHASTPFVSVYTRSGTTLTKVANPATLPSSTGYCVAWNRDNNRLAVGAGLGFKVYKWDGSTLTALSDPATLPGASVRGIAWNVDGSVLYVHSNSQSSTGAGGIFMYRLNGDTLTLMNSWASLQVPYSVPGTLGPKGYQTLAYYYDQNQTL